jgi:uncharacterized protein with NAD-binding domain and iron-sulfur cluster
MPRSTDPQRVAVIGGGMAALTAAFELAKLNPPLGAPLYDITVYQQGWRLGGKGASGRNAQRGMRIEEHGLHIWFGAYENAFRTMREVYGRTAGRWPSGDMTNAFEPQHGFTLMEKRRGNWNPWHFPLPSRPGTAPGDGAAQGRCTPRHVLHRLGSVLSGRFLPKLAISVDAMVLQHSLGSLGAAVPMAPTSAVLDKLVGRLLPEALSDDMHTREALAGALDEFNKALAFYVDKLLRTPGASFVLACSADDLRHAWIIVTVGIAVISGTLVSEAWTHDDWDALNAFDLRTWLRQHLGGQAWMADSALVEASYDLFFSYPDGNTQAGNIEAGSMLRAAVWLLLEYKGAFMWRMRSGMGDAIFAPLYRALDAMHVKFAFFHKVKKLAAIDNQITAITIQRQATLQASVAKYDPFLTDVQGCDCWPSRPQFAQLAEGVDLEAGWETGYNLESDWSTWQPPSPDIDLALGKDFDTVILGAPIATLRTLCQDLRSFDTMLQHVKTVQTQSLQLWLKPGLAELQGTDGKLEKKPVLTTFENPVDTYADMTQVVDHESWPAGAPPKHIAYFCGVLEDKGSGTEPSADPTYPAWAAVTAQHHALRLFELPTAEVVAGSRAPMVALWPDAFSSDRMRWDLLCTEPGDPASAFSQQFHRVNIDATERYVIAASGSSQFRCRAGQSGYANLFLAGDWIYNGLYLGCIEGAVISGKQAARALSGTAIPVVGEGSLFKRP